MACVDRLTALRPDLDDLGPYQRELGRGLEACLDEELEFSPSERLTFWLGPELSRGDDELRYIVNWNNTYNDGTVLMSIRSGALRPSDNPVGRSELGPILAQVEYVFRADLLAVHDAGLRLSWPAACWLHCAAREALVALHHTNGRVHGNLRPERIRFALFRSERESDPFDAPSPLRFLNARNEHGGEEQRARELSVLARAIAELTTHSGSGRLISSCSSEWIGGAAAEIHRVQHLVGVRIKLDAALDFLKSLKGEAVEVGLSSLAISCDALRAGEQTINLTADPERTAALIAKAKSAPGVVAAGWTSGSVEMDRTIRFAAGEWRDGDKINRDKIANAISGVLAKTLAAKAAGAAWNANTGKLKLTFKRQSQTYPALALTENVEVTALVSPDRPGASDRLMLWVSSPVITTADEGTGAKLNLSEESTGDEEGGEPKDDNGSLGALAKEFKAQRWDADKSAWK